MVSSTCFGITLPSSGSVPSAFWEMLNWRAVDRILYMGVLCLVPWCVAILERYAPQHTHPQYSIDCSSIEQLSEGTRNSPWRWQCNAETCRSYQRCAEGFNSDVKGLNVVPSTVKLLALKKTGCTNSQKLPSLVLSVFVAWAVTE
jgi:hypothetical protein